LLAELLGQGDLRTIRKAAALMPLILMLHAFHG